MSLEEALVMWNVVLAEDEAPAKVLISRLEQRVLWESQSP